jgi:hypothetical protein
MTAHFLPTDVVIASATKLILPLACARSNGRSFSMMAWALEHESASYYFVILIQINVYGIHTKLVPLLGLRLSACTTFASISVRRHSFLAIFASVKPPPSWFFYFSD